MSQEEVSQRGWSYRNSERIRGVREPRPRIDECRSRPINAELIRNPLPITGQRNESHESRVRKATRTGPPCWRPQPVRLHISKATVRIKLPGPPHADTKLGALLNGQGAGTAGGQVFRLTGENEVKRSKVTASRAPVAILASVLAAVAPSRADTGVQIAPNVRDMTGGVRSLDRSQYFNYHGTLVPPGNSNLGNLRAETWSEDGLNMATGRTSTELDQFISNGLPEDPNRPGFFDHAALRAEIRGPYRNFVLNGTRWEANRMHPDATFIQSGRNGGFWPDFLDSGTQMPTNYEAYADFLNVYFEEVVYGSNAFLPISQDRFYFEVMNEPQWTSAPWSEVIEMHRVITEHVKEVFPEVRIGGTSAGDKFEGSGANSWSETRDLIDDMTTWRTPSGASVEFDFWTIHNYERYDVAADGTYRQAVFNSPGHVAGIMDLFENYSHNTLGDAKQFAVTEYGSFNRTNMADGSYGSYARDEQQWDLVRDVREQLLVYMDRPDRIINATPFVAPRHWQNAVPTNAAGDNVFWEQNASGAWVETIVAKTFRMYSGVRGEYVEMEIEHPDLQAIAVRDGNKLHVLLNNLRDEAQTVDLSTISADVTAASWTRTFRSNGQNFYLSDVDITDGWNNLTLEGQAGAVLTLDLAGALVYDRALDTQTFYGADTELPVASQQFLGTKIDADLTDAVSAKLRFGFSAPTQVIPTFTVRVNGASFTVTGDELELDDNDYDLVVREFDVPIDALNAGENDVTFFFPFSGASGTISAAVLEITRSVGDFNHNGRLDPSDVDVLYSRFGEATPGNTSDLNGDGGVDVADAGRWLSLRRAEAGDVDVDGDVDSRDAVAVLANRGVVGSRPEWTRGNLDADGDVDASDVTIVLGRFTGDVGGATDAFTIDSTEVNPDLVYDPATGGLALATTGVELLAFSLTTDNEFANAADLADLEQAVGSLGQSESSSAQIGWISPDAAAGGGVGGYRLFDLGRLMPTGLDQAALGAILDSAIWAGNGIGGALDLVLLPSLAGDFNADGVVGPADYTVYRDTLGSTTDLRADANRDGRVDVADYQLWVANYGSSAAAGAAAAPEPAAGAMVVLVVAAVGGRVRVAAGR